MLCLRLTSILSLLCLSLGLAGQTIQSAQNGNWDQPSTWVNGVVPDISAESIQIAHEVRISNGVSVTGNSLTISATGTLIVDTGGILITPDSPNAIVVSGILQANEGSQISNTNPASISFQNGATYVHNFSVTEGSVPIASWDPGATIQITGYTSVSHFESAGWNQSFGNLIWNCTAQTNIINLSGLLNTEIKGSLIIANTGSSLLRLSSGEDFQLVIGQNLEVGNTARLQCTLSGQAELEIHGNFVFESTAVNGSRTNTTGHARINIHGDFLMDAPDGVLSLGDGTGSGLGTLRVAGNFSLLNGTIQESGSGDTRGRIEFTGSGEHDFINQGNLTGFLEYYIGPDTDLNLSAYQLIGNANSSLEVDGSIRVASTDPQGTIVLGSGNGAGNIRVSTRIFNPGSAIIYTGSSAQVIGNGHPADDGVDMIVQNPEGILFHAASNFNALRIGGSLILESGNLYVESSSSSKLLRLSGPLVADDHVLSFSGDQCDLVIDGTGTLNALPVSGNLTLRNLTLNRAGANLVINGDAAISQTVSIYNGALILEGTSSIHQLNMTAGGLDLKKNTILTGPASLTGGVLTFNDIELTIENQLDAAGGFLQSNQHADLRITGTGLIGNLTFTPESWLRSLYLNRLMGGVLGTITGSLRVSQTVNLVNGVLQNDGVFELAPEATITTSNISGITGIPLSGGPYHVIYTGTANISPTGAELPLNVPLASLTSLSSASVLLGRNVEVIDDILISSGTINFNGYSVTCNDIQNEGTIVSGSGTLHVKNDIINNGVFHAPTSAGLFQLAGNFANNGSFNQVGGTIEFTGSTQFTGNPPDFRNLIVTGEFFAPPVFSVRGDFTNNGIFHHQNSSVAFSGTTLTPQEIKGSSVTVFNDVHISNITADPGLFVESDVQISGVLTLEPDVHFDPDGSGDIHTLTLVSSADHPTRDASIGILPGNATISGDITIQRYMAVEGGTNGRIYRYVSSPVSNATIEDLQHEIPVTGTFNGTSNCSGCGTAPSMFEYDETVITDTNGNGLTDLNDGYKIFPMTDNSEQLEVARGYAVFVRGNVLESPVWDVRGVINRGAIDFPVSFTSSGNDDHDGWNLVGNPFPSAIDFNAGSGWTKNNIDAAIYFRDNGSSPERFAVWNGETGINGGSGVIPMGQAFWVKANGVNPQLRAEENVKVSGVSAIFFREEARNNLLRIRLTSGNATDETIIYFREGATVDFDPEFDAYKLKNSSVNLASFRDERQLLAIQALPPLSCEAQVGISIADVEQGYHELEFEGIENFSADAALYFQDRYSGAEYDLRKDSRVTFFMDESPESKSNDRFVLYFKAKPKPVVIQLTDHLVCEGSDILIKVSGSGSYDYTVIRDSLVLASGINQPDSTLITLGTENLSAGINTLLMEVSSPICPAFQLIPFEITVIPKPVIDSVTNATTCQAGSVVLAAQSLTADYLNWYACFRCEEPVRSGSFVLEIELEESQTFFVEPVAGPGCVGERVEVTASIVQFEPALIQVYGDSLFSNYANGNRWIFDGVVIDTTQRIRADQRGFYLLDVRVGDCSSRDSIDFDLQHVNDFAVFPNPVSQQLTIIDTSGTHDYFEIVLMDLLGREIIRRYGRGRMFLDMHASASGFYRLLIDSKKGRKDLIIHRK